MVERSDAKISDEAIVVGAGPVGLSLASELSRYNVSCRIIDKADHRSITSKALAIWPRSLEIFENMGIADEVLAKGNKCLGANMMADGARVAHISFDGLDSPYPFAIILPQSETEAILAKHLNSLGVNVEWQTQLQALEQGASGVTTHLLHSDGSKETFKTRWLIGCDGAHSTVRHLLQLPFEGSPYPETFILADTLVDWHYPEDELYIFLHPDGIVAFFPMGNKRFRIIADIPTINPDENPADPTMDEVQALIKSRGLKDAVIHNPIWLASFRIHHRKVSHYRQGNVFIAGDAAHIHSPAGGQGMNTGIQDAYNLAWKMGLVNAQQANNSLLNSYNEEREPVAKNVLTLTDRMTKVGLLRHPLAQKLRNHLLPIISSMNIFQNYIANTMAEVAINYRNSSAVEQHWGGIIPGFNQAGPQAGDRAMDLQLTASLSNQPMRIFEIIRGTKHILLLSSGNNSSAEIGSDLLGIWSAIDQHYQQLISSYLIIPKDQQSKALLGKEAILIDDDGEFATLYGAASPCLYLIRPDGYIGFRAMPPILSQLENYLARIYRY
jgi:2-polyprenyl-6-methoxyphenol hydroxylase-like FAD-dependent oxidoreductase